jgi:hypothetical protein
MNGGPERPSYEPGRVWSAGFNVFGGLVALLALVAMVNYLAATRLHWRHDLLASRRPQLSPLTVGTLAALTNDVTAVVLFSPGSDLFRHVDGLLREYALRSPRLKVQVVDYVRDVALATAIKSKYGLGKNTGDLVVFDAGGGRFRTVDDSEMSTYDANVKAMLQGRTNEIRRVAFRGEALFTSALAGLAEGTQLRAYFLQGHGESDPASEDDAHGHSRLVRLLSEKNVESRILTNVLSGIPADASLVILPGPTQPLLPNEVSALASYLGRGGRMLVTFPMETVRRRGGLEELMETWGVYLPAQFASDEQASLNGFDLVASSYGSHPVTIPLTRASASVHFQAPRVVVPIPGDRLPADAPKSVALVMTGPEGRTLSEFNGRELSFVEGRDRRGEVPMAVASEKGGVSGLSAARGTARLIVIGDATLFANGRINSAANRDFAALSVNWLLDRQQSLAIGPRSISEYRLNLTGSQMRLVTVALLGGLPGTALVLGFVVWFRRRS